jgi:menaquinone-9 beta-reductase
VVSGAGGRVLLAGDAARAADPLTGEGIGQALETGVDAARAVLAAGPGRPDRAAARYQRRLAHGLSLDHRLASGLSRVLAVEAGARMAVGVAGATGWGRREFARWLFEDYPRAALATPGRWGGGRGGAYRSTSR